MAGYDVYLGSMLLPITPESIDTKINGKNKTYTLINEGEMNILKLAGLSTVSFKMLLPATQYPFARYMNGYKQPSYYLDELEKLKQNKKPFQFIISRHVATNSAPLGASNAALQMTHLAKITPTISTPQTIRRNLHDTNMTVSLENYTIQEHAKDNGVDIVVDVHLKQYKEFITKTFEVTLPSPTAPIALTPARPESTVPNDSGAVYVEETSSGGGGGGTQGKKYKVQIPGMGAVEVTASSAQEAVTKAMGQNWTGTVYLNNESFTVEQGKIIVNNDTVAKVATAINNGIQSVTNTVNKAIETVKSGGLSALGNAIKDKVSSILNKNTTSNGNGTATVTKPTTGNDGKATTKTTVKATAKVVAIKK